MLKKSLLPKKYSLHSSPPLFKKVAILGLGLMGGCLAYELKRKGLAEKVVAYNRSASRRHFAKRKGFCDETYATPTAAVQGADLVVFATPVQQIPKLAEKVVDQIAAGTIVTDLGSTKEHLVQSLPRILPKHCYYVGGHPMTGTEKSGVESVVPDLFKQRWWFLTPQDERPLAKQALKRLQQLVMALDAKPKVLKPKKHDEILSQVSHLPQLVASNLMKSLWQAAKKNLAYGAGGLADTTRIAASPSIMWVEICLDNRIFILKQMKIFEKNFQRLKQIIANKDSKSLKRFFEEAAQGRRSLKK